MQKPKQSNPQRSLAMRQLLIQTARRLFLERSYAETSTPDVVAAAGVTRGALYHHFKNKQELFRAVVETEAAAVALEIDQATPADLAPLAALLAGGRAFLQAMQLPGRTQLLLIDAPAVLGQEVCTAIDHQFAARTLREGLAAAIAAEQLPPLPLDTLTSALSALFDRAALAVQSGESSIHWLNTIAAIFQGLACEPRPKITAREIWHLEPR